MNYWDNLKDHEEGLEAPARILFLEDSGEIEVFNEMSGEINDGLTATCRKIRLENDDKWRNQFTWLMNRKKKLQK